MKMLKDHSLPCWSINQALSMRNCFKKQLSQEPLNDYLRFMYQYAARVYDQRVIDLSLYVRSVVFARKAHSMQVRKYTNEPYIVHPEEVAHLVFYYTRDWEAATAAILHDVLEDTDRTYDDIEEKFGKSIADLVMMVTDVSTPEDGNRAARKAIDREHIAKGSAQAHNIKLADIMSNVASIVEHDPDFAFVYVNEKLLQIEVLTKGDAALYKAAAKVLDDAQFQLRGLK